MSLAAMRSLGSGRRLRTPQELEDFQQALVNQYLSVAVGAGLRSIFQVLKAHNVVFADLTAQLRLGIPEQPATTARRPRIDAGRLTSPAPRRAAMTALLASHGLASG